MRKILATHDRQFLTCVLLVSTVSCGLVQSLHADDLPAKDLVQVIQQNLQVEWKRLDQFVHTRQGKFKILTLRIHGSEQTEKRRTFDYYINRKVGGLKLFLREGQDPRMHSALVGNPDYSFDVTRDRDEDEYQISGYDPLPLAAQTGDGIATHIDYYLNHLMCAGCGPELVFNQLFASAPVIVGVEPAHAAPPLPHLTVKFKVDNDAKEEHYKGEVVLMPDFHWAVKSCLLETPYLTLSRTIDYYDDLDGVAFPQKIVEETSSPQHVVFRRDIFEFERPSLCELPAAEFRFPAFGLGEMTPTRNSRAWIIGVNVAIFVILCALLIKRRKAKGNAASFENGT